VCIHAGNSTEQTERLTIGSWSGNPIYHLVHTRIVDIHALQVSWLLLVEFIGRFLGEASLTGEQGRNTHTLDRLWLAKPTRTAVAVVAGFCTVIRSRHREPGNSAAVQQARGRGRPGRPLDGPKQLLLKQSSTTNGSSGYLAAPSQQL
jgi:hypothetical protein